MAVGAPKPPVIFPDPTRHMHMVINYLDAVGNELAVAVGDGTTRTIASGIISASSSFHLIAVDSVSDDELDEIRGPDAAEGKGKLVTGQRLTIAPESDAITVKSGTGATNAIKLSGGLDFTMSNIVDTLTLIWDGTDWLEVGRSVNA